MKLSVSLYQCFCYIICISCVIPDTFAALKVVCAELSISRSHLWSVVNVISTDSGEKSAVPVIGYCHCVSYGSCNAQITTTTTSKRDLFGQVFPRADVYLSFHFTGERLMCVLRQSTLLIDCSWQPNWNLPVVQLVLNDSEFRNENCFRVYAC